MLMHHVHGCVLVTHAVIGSTGSCGADRANVFTHLCFTDLYQCD